MSVYIDNIIQHGNKIKNIKLDSNTKHTISELYEQLKLAYRKFDHVFNYKNIHEYISIQQQNVDHPSQILFPKTFRKSDFPNQVVHTITNSSKSIFEFHYMLGEKSITIYFILNQSLSEIDVSSIYRKVELMIIWIQMLSQYADPKCSHQLTVYIYATDLMKMLPQTEGTILDWEHVNTAFTRGCNKVSEIVIFRAEEWFKVFIHETLHCFGIDFTQHVSIQQSVQKMFHIRSEVLLSESYVEFWAEIINIMFYIFMNDRKSQIRKSIFMFHFEILMNLERKYALIQMTKVLRYMQLTYLDMIDEPKSQRRYKENANVFAYYVVKCIFYYHVNDMLQWCRANNANVLQFNEKSQNELCEFINKHYRNRAFLKDIYYAQSIRLDRSLRMTIYDILVF